MTYLGHVVSANGVAMDAGKVATVESWRRPRTIKALCGFLGLPKYYLHCGLRHGRNAADGALEEGCLRLGRQGRIHVQLA